MDIKNVVVAGGGVLGSQIAFQCAYSGYHVTIWLRSEGSIGRCQPKIDHLRQVYLDTLEAMKSDPSAYAYGLLAKQDVTPEACEAAKAKVEAAYQDLTLTTSYEDALSDADFVIESIAENPKDKIAFYTEMSKHVPANAVVCTNSSSMLPSAFASHVAHPERYLALHFANSIWKNPSAEVMPHAGTSKEAFDETVSFAASIRMVPLKIMKEQPGYLLNSLLIPFLSAGQALWANGIGSPEDIDLAWKLGTGAPNGPFQILDVVGLTTAYNIASMNPAAKDPTSTQAKVIALLKEKIDAGETGVAAGKGFYDYH
ncbi:3-hydroxyacyl-CoA dehydrogenase [Thermophilibacter immobilis]|jgi:3-hydroxybutyryl-CoA dehydrogenase|uniref:3-hydroxyacyl-CoA dehydrogenase n=1 Tax=Thermophilibacter immobilis TaxID=2779519 RepID=A0A7S7RUL5_9ACTN|nr:3-hydroxyacyl-CoA dehydrogenase [Thermophilibacter immobilis]QOY60394.1 3-hydroxyacyl-CoA dehydrogenase [Thermophilibacter immobilis]